MIDLKSLRRKWWLLLPVAPVLYGTLGFRLLEGWSWAKSFFMTIITVSTVGFDDGGMGDLTKVFTTTLIVTGVGAFSFTLTYVIRDFVENLDPFQRRIRRRLERMKDHFVVCGAGRVGLEMAEELHEKKVPFVVLEQDPETINTLRSKRLPFIDGDATDEEIQVTAGVREAKAMACVLATDADNVFTTLTARELNPKLYIVARASSRSASSKLLRAGADRVLNPFSTTANRMVFTLLKPTVTDFLEIASGPGSLDLAIEEIPIPSGSVLDECRITDSQIRQRENVIVAAIQKKGGRMLFNPSPSETIQAGDVLISLGSRESLDLLEKRIQSTK